MGHEVSALRNKPKLSLESAEVATAFRVLNATRTSNGFALNPLSLNEIKAYTDLMGMPWMGPQVFVRLLTDMDQAFLKIVRKKPGS